MVSPPVFLLGESHGQRNLAGYSPKSDRAEVTQHTRMVLLQVVPLVYRCKCKGSLHPYVCFLRQWTRKSTTYAISLVQLLSCVQLFATLWTAARQASLSITNSWSLLKFMSIKLVISSNHLILCHHLLLPSIFPSIRVFSNESVLHIRYQSTGISASASVLPMNTQD